MYTGNKAAGGVRNPICCCSYCGYNFCHYVLLTHRRTGSCLSAGLVQKTHILWMLPEIFSGRKYWRLFLTVKSFNWAWQKKILGWKVWSINLNSWNPPNFLSCCPQLQEKCTLFPTPILMLFLAPQIPGEVNYCFSQAILRAQPSCQVPCSTREAVTYNVGNLCVFFWVAWFQQWPSNVKMSKANWSKFPCPRQDMVGSVNGKYRGRCL